MPRFDGTGPTGTGPNGRGMGPCSGGYAGAYQGGFAGRGRGRGFFRAGFGWGMGQTDVPPFATKEAMQQRKTWLESQLATVSKQLEDLNNK